MYVSDRIFEAVFSDIQTFPMSSMRAISSRTGVKYGTVALAVRIMAGERSIVRKRIGGIPNGLGATYAVMVNPDNV